MIDRMAGLALAGAGLGGAGLAVAGLNGYLPNSKQQELEQLKALNVTPPPELEQQAKDEQIAQWGTAALSVGAGTGLGLLVDRFAGSPEVVEKLVAVKSGQDGMGVPASVSSPGNSWVQSGRLATEEEARQIVNIMTRHVSSEPLEALWNKNAIKHVAERIKGAGAAELGTALDLVDANWDGELNGIQKIVDVINGHAKATTPAMYQAMVDSITPEMASSRHVDDQMDEFFDFLHTGNVYDNGIELLEKAIINPGLTPAERQMAAAGRILTVQHGLSSIPKEDVLHYLHALDSGEAGGYQDRRRGDMEFNGLDPMQFKVPEWALSFKGIGRQASPYKTPDEILAGEMYSDDFRRKAGLPPLTTEELSKERQRHELRDKHRRLRLGL